MSSLPSRKWIDIYPTKNKNETCKDCFEYLMMAKVCKDFFYEFCTTKAQRKCERLCNTQCPETCSVGGFEATTIGRNYNTYAREWDPNISISCV